MTSAIGMAKGMNDVQAWIHDVVQDDGEADHALSFSADSFPLQGVGGFRSLRARPLYTAAPSEILLAYENMIADYAALQQQLAAAREALKAQERDARAWRNRFIDERMRTYEDKGYEMARCYAESDANDFIEAFHATLQRDRQP